MHWCGVPKRSRQVASIVVIIVICALAILVLIVFPVVLASIIVVAT